RGWSLARLIERLTPILRGWGNYYRLTEVQAAFQNLDQWIRRRLRCILWRQAKRVFTRARMLMKRGLPEEQAWRSATNGRGSWWNAGAAHMHLAYPKRFFDHLGLFSLLDMLRLHWSRS
ncbi:MAG: group II intron maturase-specific domain-containing protein, partial [bacterium]|nr:group II intron maturase-specific domain-containing protein [bacterium]